jgi:hypothetical protein
MKSIREKFEQDFSPEAAELIYKAALSHRNGIHDNQGSDPFKWAICICLGYDCTSTYQVEHGLAEFNDRKFRQWIKEHGHLEHHDGDVDYLALMSGVYNEYMPSKVEKD